jgi:uncharacterized protein with HEPN domain
MSPRDWQVRILVHVYFEVDPRLVWDTIKNDLPSLISSLENLLS